MSSPIVLACDHAQRRISVSAVTMALRDTELYDKAQSSNVFIEPIRKTAMLRPYALDAAWWTSNAGNYAKYTIGGGIEVKTSAKWREPVLYPSAGTFLQCDDASGEYARTSSAVAANRGVSLSYFAYATGDRGVLLECGWSNSTTPTADTASTGLQIHTDGKVLVYRDGDLAGEYSISGAGAGSQSTQNNLVSLIILPCRRRELIVFSTAGSGFAHVLEDIAEGETSPVISANEKFFVVPGSGVTNLQCQFQPLSFPTSGQLVSGIYNFGIAPQASQSLYAGWNNPTFPGITDASIYGDTAFAGATNVSAVYLRNSANSGAFAADGAATQARARIDLSGDGSFSPFIYGVIFEFEQETADTDDSERFEFGDHLKSLGLTVPDEPFGSTLDFELSGEEDGTTLESQVANIYTQSFRPVELLQDETQFWEGFLLRPNWEDALRADQQRARMQAYEIATALHHTVFRSRVPLDGWALCLPIGDGASAVSYILNRAGLDSADYELSDAGFVIGEIPSESGGEWNVIIEEGETCAQALEKLHRLAPDWFYGSHPVAGGGVGFWFRKPDDMPATPAITLYRSRADAISADPGLTDSDAANLLYHGFNEQTLIIEANEVRATGINPRTGQLIQSYAVYEESQDPTTAPSARPEGWAGFALPLGVAARQFRRQEDTDAAVTGLFPVATELGKVCEWSANNWLFTEDGVPVWRGDLVDLDGIGERRVSAFSAAFVRELSDHQVRTAKYSGGTPRGKGGVTITQIQGAQQARLTQRLINDLIAAPLGTLGILQVSKVTP